MIIHGAAQGTEEWYQARTGVITASRFKDVIAFSPDKWKVIRKTGTVLRSFDNEKAASALAVDKGFIAEHHPGKSLQARNDYMLELANEILTETLDDDAEFSSFWMDRGKRLEPEARKWYEFITGNEVKEAGLIYLNKRRRIGASVDGLIGDDGNAEIKCLKRFNHTRILLSDEVPQDYLDQIQGQMLVTGRPWCDFIAYHPGAYIEGYIQRVERNENYIKYLHFRLAQFIEELDEIIGKLKLMAT